jgi:hypothetical protein
MHVRIQSKRWWQNILDAKAHVCVCNYYFRCLILDFWKVSRHIIYGKTFVGEKLMYLLHLIIPLGSSKILHHCQVISNFFNKNLTFKNEPQLWMHHLQKKKHPNWIKNFRRIFLEALLHLFDLFPIFILLFH